jgi:hypothetical protein
MLIPSKGKAIELLNRSLPYPDQMKDFDLEKDGAIYFTWRQVRYKLDLNYCRVEESEGSFLTGTDASILMGHLLKSQLGSVL